MAIRYPEVLSIAEPGRPFSWTDRETMLYALAIGMGGDPDNGEELPFVYERNLKAVPTLATVVAWGANIGPERIGLNRALTVHGEESITWHRPMPAAGSVIASSRVVAAYDKGQKGAVIEREVQLRDVDGTLLVSLLRTAFARGDGGFGGPSESPPPHQVPTRAADLVLEFATRPDQALLYRLCGDRNPLHADPAAAKAGGFPRPILHGLCTYGICCRAILQAYCGFEPERMRTLAARFSAPVLPGDRIAVRLWKDHDIVSFEASVPGRDVTVIKSGRSRID
ncbi:MAG TPA: MaoC/PaaZ C-terminal domain-containing protein [Steroidobacteraceae bacterium]|nr:MaoC/PaaZ C-terminal domain-containing protein [Steroidobacteraceae bacterium]